MDNDHLFYEISPLSLNRDGEEVCGDQVKILGMAHKTIMVLSDGLGSGIKATILARLTTEILVNMLRANAPLGEVLETVTKTLPVCHVRKLAYATFVILEIDHSSGRFELVSFDSPPAVLLKNRKSVRLETRGETVGGKLLNLSQGVLEEGDFLGLMSDGVLYADKGVTINTLWGWNEVAAFLEKAAQTGRGSAQAMAQTVIRETERRYGGKAGDDATFIGILARKPSRLMVFTGPPADRARDEACVERLLYFDGHRVVCGGTSGNIVAQYLGRIVRTDNSSARDGIPPVGYLPEIELVTEGILTLARTLEMLKDYEADHRRLPADPNGAVLLSRELLQADSILFLASESVNPYYQNPQLPRSISIRRSLVTQITEVLKRLHKNVTVEWI